MNDCPKQPGLNPEALEARGGRPSLTKNAYDIERVVPPQLPGKGVRDTGHLKTLNDYCIFSSSSSLPLRTSFLKAQIVCPQSMSHSK